MIHYLLLKFKAGRFTPTLYQLAEETFRQIAGSLNGIQHLEVYQNGVQRDTNADLMIRMELKDREHLNAYLNHPLHLRFVQQVDGAVEQRVTFDQL